jgi:hypothetical protein
MWFSGTKRDAIKLACTTVFDPHDRAGFGSRTYYQLQAMRSQLMSPCSQPIAYLDCVQPVVIWTDAVWAAVVDFYPEYSSKLTLRGDLA